MPRFQYEIINAEGNTQSGEMDGPSLDIVADSLQKRGCIVLGITDASGPGNVSSSAAAPSGDIFSASDFKEPKKEKQHSENEAPKSWWERMNEVSTKGSVKLATLLLFTSQLASMVGAGLHLLKSLNSLAEDASDKKFQKILNEVRKDVEGGEAFSTALSKFPKVFSSIYVNLIKAAEATGDLDVILNQLAVYLEKTMTLRRKVKGAMTYPCVILSFAFIAILILIAKIVPSFQSTFSKLGAELPAPTKMLIFISDVIRNYFLVVFFSFASVIFAIWRLINTEKGRYIWDCVIVKIPIFGPLIWKSVLTRFLRTLSILLESGVTVLEAFALAGQASGNKMLERAAYFCIDDIRDGKSIHESLEARHIFPGMVIRMVASGEEAGTMPEMLKKTVVYFEQQVETAVEALSSLIEPILIVVLGTIVGAIIVAIFLPIFKLGSAVKGH